MPVSASEVGTYTERHFSLGLGSNRPKPKVKLNHDTAFTPNQVNSNTVGGRLRLFSNEWQKLTSDTHILQAISAYKLEFENGPPLSQSRPPVPYRLKHDEKCAVDAEVEKLLSKDVIEISDHEGGQFISNIFTRPKKDGGHRMILDLSELNEYITYRHFKMDTFDTARSLITKNCYMASLDLRDAYYSVPIAESDRKYLKFFWNNTLYHFKALPNGLGSGPRLFTKILKPPLAALRSIGHVITGYIDDSLLVADTKEEAARAVTDSAKLLAQLGFIIHPEKSIFEPTQEIEYLGFVVNSNDMLVSLPQSKKLEISDSCASLLSAVNPKIRTVAKVIGKVVAAFPAVQYGPLHYRKLESDKTAALKANFGHFDRKMQLTDEAKSELQWWIQNIDQSFSCIYRGKPDIEISSDASGLGWGATNGSTHIGGRWNEFEAMIAARNEINYLELLAAFFALKSFCRDSRNIHVKMNIDNTTAVAYISHMGGSKSSTCNELAKQFWAWCIDRQIWVSVAHLPGVENVIADRKSRVFQDETEWMLNKEIFQQLCTEYEPSIDLFASRLNAQLPCYVSWKPDPEAESIDALSIDWGPLNFYAFPPFCIIAKCLQKIIQDEAEGIIIIPRWPTQPWFPKLLNMLIEIPIILPSGKVLLTLPGTEKVHPLNASLVLLACRVSGMQSRTKEFQRQLPISSWRLGEIQQRPNIAATSEDGYSFVVKDKLITCRLML